jgi:hypothetical protein
MRRSLLGIGVLASLAGSSGAAQETERTIGGTVRDDLGHPIGDAIVALDPGPSTVLSRTNSRGAFRFPRLRQGRYHVAAVWEGFLRFDTTVHVEDSRVELTIVLRRAPTSRDSARGERTGVTGIVVSRYHVRPLAGAIVRVVGSANVAQDTTGADGRFALAVPGTVRSVILAEAPGHVGTFRSVQTDSATGLAFVLDSVVSDVDRRMAFLLDAFARRTRARGSRSVLIPAGAEFRDRGQMAVQAVAPYLLRDHEALRRKGLRLEQACYYVYRLPPSNPNERFQLIDGSDIEAVEVHVGVDMASPAFDTQGCRTYREGIIEGQRSARYPGMVVIWLRSIEWDAR